MDVVVILTLCVLLLIAYVFDISSKFTKIPSVILLIALGILLRVLSTNIGFVTPVFLSEVLPILGSIGLILIVLEGALELELSKSKNGLILKSFMMALLPMLALGIGLAWLFHLLTEEPLLKCMINALPLSVISSAIAIPSVRNLSSAHREFIVFESSFSDILGVMFFNFFVLNKVIDGTALLNFSWDLVLMILMAFIATILLSLLLNSIRHHVRFVPIILLVILTYEFTKVLHLPGLIFVLIFGLFLGNIEQLSHFKWLQKLNPIKLKKEVDKFEELVIEFAFLIRTSFFMLFGFLLKPEEILNASTLLISFQIFFAVLLFRAIFLLILKLPVFPLIYIAPRGLITVLLFLSIPAIQFMPIVNNSVLVQVIILTALWMMFGLITQKKEKKSKSMDKIIEEEEGNAGAEVADV